MGADFKVLESGLDRTERRVIGTMPLIYLELRTQLVLVSGFLLMEMIEGASLPPPLPTAIATAATTLARRARALAARALPAVPGNAASLIVRHCCRE